MNASGPLTLASSVDVGGELIDISVGTKVWGVNRSHDIYRYDDGNWTKIEGKLKAISVADDGTVVGVNGQDEIYVYENQNWRKLNVILMTYRNILIIFILIVMFNYKSKYINIYILNFR